MSYKYDHVVFNKVSAIALFITWVLTAYPACLPYSPALTHASLSGDPLEMPKSTVLCHTPRP